MKALSRWIRRHSSKNKNKIDRRTLRHEFLEPRQLLAGDMLQASRLDITAGQSASALVGSSNAADVPRAPLTARAPLSLDAGGALGIEVDTGETTLNVSEGRLANAAIATHTDGSFIVVRQQVPANGSTWNLYAQRYDKDGNRIGSQFRVNHYTKNDQINPQIAIAPNGSFTVVWQSTYQLKRGWEMYARSFSAEGEPTRRERALNIQISGDQANPVVTYVDNDRYVVAWDGPGKGDDSGIYARIVENDARVGSEIRVSQTTKGGQQRPTVTATPEGGFIVAWDGNGSGDKTGIFMREFDADGVPVGSEVRVNSDTSRDDESPHISMDEDGNFAIVWQHDARDSGWDVYAQSFLADGTRNGGVVLVNETISEDQSNPTIAHLNNGDFIVAWEGAGAEDEMGIYARRFTASGDAMGEQVLMNLMAAPDQQATAIASLSDGVAIVWESPKTEGRYSIYMRRLRDADLNEAPVIEPIADDVTGLNTPYTVPVIITDEDTPESDLTISATATGNATAEFDEALPGVLTVTPEFGFTGQINVVVTVSDGINVPVTETFRVTVVNMPPVITPIEDRFVAENTATEITVEATDPDTAQADLTYLAVANNATAEFDDAIRNLLTVTPETGFLGTIEVTVTVSDGETAVAESFQLEVTTDLPPVIQPIADVTSAIDEATDITVEVADEDTLLADLMFSATASNNATVEFSATNPNEFTVTPEPGFTGVIDVTVTVKDTVNTISESFQITVSGPPQLDLNGPGEAGTGVDTQLTIGAGPRDAGLENLSIDDDGDSLVSAVVQLTNVLNPADELLAVDTAETFINASYEAATGTLLLVGNDTLANYETVLRSLRYENVAKDQDLTDRIIEITVNDGANTSNAASARLTLASADLVAFAKDLAATETKFFGAAWCPHCTDQKELFQDGQLFLPFVEVTNPNRTPNEIGMEEEVFVYPTWEFPDGSRLEGLQDLLTLSERSGVPIRTASQPFIAPIDDVTLLSGVELLDDDGNVVEGYDPVGSPLFVSLDGYDPNGGNLTYEVISNNPDVTAEILTGNRSALIKVAGFGNMVFELFEDKASRATEQMIELATNTTRLVDADDDGEVDDEIPFYQDIIFHRVINDFVIQAGDPTGLGSGGSELDDFDDQFNFDLQHNRTGLLSMAKTDDDTNNSQFFITEGTARHLDFNHTIFGVLVEGEKNRDAISNTDTVGGRPTISVAMEGIDIFSDNENAVVLLKAAPRTIGDAIITVIVTDPNGNTYETSFNVTIEQDITDRDADPQILGNGGPFLTDFVDTLDTDVNTPVSFDLEAMDVEGDAVYFDSNTSGVAGEYEFEMDNDTGEVTVTPVDDFIGTIEFLVGVRSADGEPNDTGDTFDSQRVTITVGNPLPPVELGEYTDEDLLGTKTYELPGAPEIVEGVHVSGDIDYSDYTNPPSYGPHHPTQDGVVPRPTGVYDTAQDDEDLVHNLEHGHVWISYNPALLDAADVTALEDLVVSFGQKAGVILTPRSANTSAIALASWGHLLELDTLDAATIRAFATTNRGHAPEGFIL